MIDFLKIERFFGFPKNCTVLLQILCMHHEVEGLSVKKQFLKMSEFLVYYRKLKDFTKLTISRPHKRLVLDIRESGPH